MKEHPLTHPHLRTLLIPSWELSQHQCLSCPYLLERPVLNFLFNIAPPLFFPVYLALLHFPLFFPQYLSPFKIPYRLLVRLLLIVYILLDCNRKKIGIFVGFFIIVQLHSTAVCDTEQILNKFFA